MGPADLREILVHVELDRAAAEACRNGARHRGVRRIDEGEVEQSPSSDIL